MNEKAIILKNWSIVLKGDAYTPPEFLRQGLSGDVFGHPKFEDGEEITTSSIIGKNSDGDIVVKSGNVYHLENIDPEYAKRYPDAEEKLKSTCPLIV